MVRRVRFLKRLLADLPRQLRLAYCLMRDERVPVTTKAVLGGSLALVMSPLIDTRRVLPVVGEIDVLALTLLTLRLFIAACPEQVVADNQQLIIEQRSRFDEDLRAAERLVRQLIGRFTGSRDGAAESDGDRAPTEGQMSAASASGRGRRWREDHRHQQAVA